ncbi:MAG: hypothetical protein MK110_02945 [Fuerstiella sp.]|nr:hypothetical protein [Fuerstiella sp.]
MSSQARTLLDALRASYSKSQPDLPDSLTAQKYSHPAYDAGIVAVQPSYREMAPTQIVPIS